MIKVTYLNQDEEPQAVYVIGPCDSKQIARYARQQHSKCQEVSQIYTFGDKTAEKHCSCISKEERGIQGPKKCWSVGCICKSLLNISFACLKLICVYLIHKKKVKILTERSPIAPGVSISVVYQKFRWR